MLDRILTASPLILIFVHPVEFVFSCKSNHLNEKNCGQHIFMLLSNTQKMLPGPRPSSMLWDIGKGHEKNWINGFRNIGFWDKSIEQRKSMLQVLSLKFCKECTRLSLFRQCHAHRYNLSQEGHITYSSNTSLSIFLLKVETFILGPYQNIKERNVSWKLN